MTLNPTNQLLDLVHEGFDLAIRPGHLKRFDPGGPQAGAAGPCVPPAYTARHGMPNSLSELAPSHLPGGQRDEWHFTLNGETPQRGYAVCFSATAATPLPGCGYQGTASSSCRTT